MITLLIDADVLVWKAASAVQSSFDFGTVISSTSDFGRARDKFDEEVSLLIERFNATKTLLAFSDPNENWRKSVLPSYKANRSRKKPLVFWQLREHAETSYWSEWYPKLEGDDVLGLYATGDKIVGKRVVVSIDKDMRQVPCSLYNPGHPEWKIKTTGAYAADYFHMMQTLTGDVVDGYKGIPGCGPKKAMKVLSPATCSVALWPLVLSAFLSAGLSRADALQQARVSRILRSGEYNKSTATVKLWEPPE